MFYAVLVVFLLVILVLGLLYYLKNNDKTQDPPNKKSVQRAELQKDYYLQEQKRKAGRKGELGEYKNASQLDSLPKEFNALHDIMLKTRKGFSQIDHIVVSPYGIFVIEAKNYDGWIFGDQDKKFWIQTFPNGRKNRFYNPIWQNNGHVKALKDALKDFNSLEYFPIITFTRRCELRGIKAKETVIFDTELSRVIEAKCKKLENKNIDVNAVCQRLNELNITDQKLREQHIRNVKHKQYK